MAMLLSVIGLAGARGARPSGRPRQAEPQRPGMTRDDRPNAGRSAYRGCDHGVGESCFHSGGRGRDRVEPMALPKPAGVAREPGDVTAGDGMGGVGHVFFSHVPGDRTWPWPPDSTTADESMSAVSLVPGAKKENGRAARFCASTA
jgi:hypothetical protein